MFVKRIAQHPLRSRGLLPVNQSSVGLHICNSHALPALTAQCVSLLVDMSPQDGRYFWRWQLQKAHDVWGAGKCCHCLTHAAASGEDGL